MSKEKSQGIIYLLIPVLLVIINLFLKVLYLDNTPIANDEPFSIFMAQLDVPSIINHLKTGNNPPFFEITLHYWIKLFGISPFSVRLLPLLFSAFAVYWIYKLGLKFFSLNIGIIASLLYTFSTYHIYYAHEARVYSLFALFTCISMYAFFSLAKEPSKRKYFFLLLFANVILIYSHFFGLMVLILQAVSVLTLRQLRQNVLRPFLILSIITFIAYLPYVSIFITRFIDSSAGGTWLAPSGLEEAYNMIWKFSNQPVTAILFLVILLVAGIKFIREKPSIGVFGKSVLIWFFLPFLAMFILSLEYFPFQVPMFLDRYLVFVSIAFYLLMAISIDYILRQMRFNYVFSLVPILFMVFSFNLNPTNKRPVNEMVATIKEIKTENTIVYMCPEWLDINFLYYYDRDNFQKVAKEKPLAALARQLHTEKIYPIASNLHIADFNQQADQVIFIDFSSEFTHPGNKILEQLSKDNIYVETIDKHLPYKIHIFKKTN